jgi:hypothetical protein
MLPPSLLYRRRVADDTVVRTIFPVFVASFIHSRRVETNKWDCWRFSWSLPSCAYYGSATAPWDVKRLFMNVDKRTGLRGVLCAFSPLGEHGTVVYDRVVRHPRHHDRRTNKKDQKQYDGGCRRDDVVMVAGWAPSRWDE